MGLRGPPKTPTAINELRGNPGKRPSNKREPKPPKGEVPYPSRLDADGKREWKRLIPILQKMGILTLAERDLLEIYCSMKSDWLKCQRDIRKRGMLITAKNKNGSRYLQKNPLMVEATKLESLMRGYLRELGLTPASRVSLEANTPDPVSDGGEDLETFIESRGLKLV